MLHELFPTARQTTKIRNAFVNNESTDTKLTQVQISKITWSGGFVRNMLGNLCKKVVADLAIPLARDNLPKLISKLASSSVNKFERKISGTGTVRAGKGFTLFILNEDMNDIIKIIKSLQDSNVLIDGIIGTVKHEMVKKKGWFLPTLLVPLAALLVQPVISSVVKGISESGVTRGGRWYMNKKF